MKTKNTKLQILTPNAGDKHQIQKGTQTYKTELPKFANEPQMYKR